MKPILPPRRIAAGLVACMATCTSWALTIGRPQGLPLIGRPLDLHVPIALDGEPLPECATADVFYGDSRIARDRVSSDLSPAAGGATLHVRATAAIDEPVVTLYLQLGCTNRISRRVVLLAEQPDLQGEVPRAVPPRPAAVGPMAAAPRRDAPAAPVERASPAPAKPAPVRAAKAQPAPRTRPAAAHRPVRVPARLQLEPLETALAARPTLRLSDTLALPAQEATTQQRAQAGATWRALMAPPEDRVRDARRLEDLDKDLRSVRQSIQRNDAALVDLRGRLQRAESARFANPLVYALAGLALAALAAAAWFRRRRREAEDADWWRPREGGGEVGGDAGVLRADPSPVPAPVPATAPGRLVAAAPAVPSAGFPPVAPAVAPRSRAEDFHASQPLSLRSLRAEELHDVQQEADFFVSLGEYERAIEVLRAHIRQNPETSALAWLDLLEIFHKLGRHEDFDRIRDEFQRRFNATVPEFEQYSQEGTGLEGYERAMSRIVALWPSRRVLDVIDESIFRGPGQDGGMAFSLQAYRELLLLHHIGSEVLEDEASRGRGEPARREPPASVFGASGGFSATEISPLLTASASRPGFDSMPGIGGNADFGLDINLDEPGPQAQPLAGPAGAERHLIDFDLPEVDSGPPRDPGGR